MRIKSDEVSGGFCGTREFLSQENKKNQTEAETYCEALGAGCGVEVVVVGVCFDKRLVALKPRAETDYF